MFTGGFTSKRGKNWNYEIHECGGVVQWRENIVRVTGGWARGSDIYAKRISAECFEAIEATYGFKRNPKYSDEVIITDMSSDKPFAEFINNYEDTITMSTTPENKIRTVYRRFYNKIRSIQLFDTREEAVKYVKSHIGTWEEKT